MVYTHPSMVNLLQTPEERKEKYHYCRAIGFNSYEAQKLRDWRWDFILWFIDRWINKVTPEETFSQIRTRLSRENEQNTLQAGQA